MSRTMPAPTRVRRVRQRPSRASRRFGYAVSAVVNAAMLYAVNRWPGWEQVPFLTDDTRKVLDLVNASIIVGLVANVVYLARDPRWLKAAGDLVTTTVGLVALVRLWQVFPFDVAQGSTWELVARAALVLGIFGSAVAILVAVVTFVRAVVLDPSDPTRKGP